MKRLLTVALLLAAHQPRADACPAAIPAPATDADVACFTLAKPIETRCATAVSATVCNFLNNKALSLNLVTQAGYNYLVNTGFCAMVNNYGEGDRIYDFCPMGCFAADTNVLADFSHDGKASYAAAASVKPQSKLMALAETASLDDVVLAPRAVKRTVRGPESAELFVFTLANGATLRVTQHHPMVLSSGKIVEAQSVSTQMAFVGLDGDAVAIATIAREKPAADVFNFETQGESQLSHILVAEGVLVGDLKLQNELANEEGSIALRR